MSNDETPPKWDGKRWLWVLLCSLAIFATIPLARSIQKIVEETVGREYFGYAVIVSVGVCFSALLYWLISRSLIKESSRFVWLTLIAGVYVYVTIQLWSNPEEAIHFLEYGLLSYLVFRALVVRISDGTIYLTAALFVLFVGTLDEVIQWMIPNRSWDYRDVGLNGLSGVLLQVAIWKGVRPKLISASVKRISIRMLMGILAANLLLMLLCFSNTPNAMYRYTTVLPSLSWLRTEEPMTEFGYEHEDPDIGTFYSRLSLRELEETDLLYGESYGEILSQMGADSLYGRFILYDYTPFTNPFLHELRVHLFRRNIYDRHTKEAEDKDNQSDRIKFGNIAFSEHLIAEKYFGRTLNSSTFAWTTEKVGKFRKLAALGDRHYTSGVSRGIVTSFSLVSVWTVFFVALTVVWVGGYFWQRRVEKMTN